MKKLLSILTAITLSTTASISILKPLFTNNTNANDDFKKKLINKQMNIENQQMSQTQDYWNDWCKFQRWSISLRCVFPENKRYLGVIETNGKKIPSEQDIKNALKKLGTKDVWLMKINNINETSATITPRFNSEIFMKNFNGKVIVNYDVSKYIYLLKAIVPDLNQRIEKVETFSSSFHEEILDAKIDILKDNKFKNLPNINKFIDELNEIVKFKANQNSLDAFSRIENNTDNFSSFADLNQQFNCEHLLIGGKINFTSFINKIRQNMKDKRYPNLIIDREIEKLKIKLCRFYNILAQVYGKENVFKMLKEIILDNKLTQLIGADGQTPVGECNNDICHTQMFLDTDSFSNAENGIRVMVHEYGHVLDFFITRINNKKYEWIYENVNSWLAEGTKINDPNYQELLTYGIIRSSYARTAKHYEFFAEAFTRWIITPEENRDLGWEKLDQFFRVYLPTLI